MEWIKSIAELISSLAWPVTALILAILFRRDIRQRLKALKELKYPGGSITMQEVELLQASVEQNQPRRIETDTPEQPSLPFSDPKLAIAQGRIDVERELFRLSWRALGQSEVTNWRTTRHIDGLERADVITSHFAQNLRSFIDVANRVIHGTDVSPHLMARTASIAVDLLSTLRYKRLVYEAQRDFEGHGLWHMRERKSKEQHLYYIMSVVASQIAEYGYEYDVYREAVDMFNARQRSDTPAAPGGELPVLTLDQFVQALEWREKELKRLRNDLRTAKWDEYDKANRWTWPSEWGDLRWSTSILRERVSQFSVEQELMQTAAALERHRTRARGRQ